MPTKMKMEYDKEKQGMKVTFADGSVVFYSEDDEIYPVKIGLKQLECMRDGYIKLNRPVTEELLADIKGYQNMLAYPDLAKEYMALRQKEMQSGTSGKHVRPHHYAVH